MNEASLQFHIEENDYFGTLATVLDLVSQDLRNKGHFRNAETLLRLREDLVYLQDRYHIRRGKRIHRPRTEWSVRSRLLIYDGDGKLSA